MICVADKNLLGQKKNVNMNRYEYVDSVHK